MSLEQLLAWMPPGSPDDSLHSNIHFRNTYLKTAEIYAQMPELHLEPLNEEESPPFRGNGIPEATVAK